MRPVQIKNYIFPFYIPFRILKVDFIASFCKYYVNIIFCIYVSQRT